MKQPIGSLLGTGNVAEVFAWDDGRVIKLYREPVAKAAAFREAAIQAAVEELGLPVPAVWDVRNIDGRWGVVFDRIEGPSLWQRMQGDPSCHTSALDHMARLHVQIHACPAARFASLHAKLAADITRAEVIDERRKSALLAGLGAMPDGDRLCHGDFHPLNILGDPRRPIVIDWPDATCGQPAADVCRSYLMLRLHVEDLAVPYLDAYCRTAGLSRDPVLAWMPFVAGARLAERIAGEADRLLDLIAR